MYDLQKQKQEMQQIIAAQEQELQRLHALLAKSVRPTQNSASNTQPLEAAEQHRRTGRSHASQDRIVQLEVSHRCLIIPLRTPLWMCARALCPADH